MCKQHRFTQQELNGSGTQHVDDHKITEQVEQVERDPKRSPGSCLDEKGNPDKTM